MRDIERERLALGRTKRKEQEPSGGRTSKSYTTPIFHRIEQLQHPKWDSYNSQWIGYNTLTEQLQPLTEQLQHPKVNRFTKILVQSIVMRNMTVKNPYFCYLAGID